MSLKWLLVMFMGGMFIYPSATANAVFVSEAADQTAIEVTVYNNNLGLVKDERTVQLDKGQGELRFMDVASGINPVTVHAKSTNQPNQFGVLEQNYEYDLMDSNKLLDKYVGKTVKLLHTNEYQNETQEIDALLLSNNNGQIFQIGDEIFLGHPGIRILPEIPENLIAKPTLTWLFDNGSSKAHSLEVSYLTNGINWKADYVLVLNDKDTEGSFSGWVTVDNKSGATYKQAKLKLIAGDVNRVQPAVPQRAYMAKTMMMEDSSAAFAEKAFFEYHIYDLQRKTTIKDRQTKQISLLDAGGVGIKKELLLQGAQGYYTYQYRPRSPKQKINVYIKFKNAESNNLGMPIPAGVIRLYKADADDKLQFIGEDRVGHTPKDEEIKLRIGEAFDVVAERKQTDYRKIGNNKHESAWEVTLRNHKEEPVTVGVIEPLYGSWKVLESSHTYEKKDAFTIRYDVDVPANGEVKVTYRIQVWT